MATPWTEGRKRAFIVAVLRNGTRRYPPKYETLNEAKTEKKINKKTGRQAQHYACAVCQKDFPQKEVQVDHKKPAVDPKTGFISWDVYIERLFCGKENLQVLCKPCHDAKTKGEREFAKGERQSKLTKPLKPKKVPSSLKAPSRKKKPTT
jgi:5-methylcytosine-specific restriction endonuclease McrA